MWGEVLEEDLYDANTPFYDDDLNKKLTQQREANIQYMLEQDRQIRELEGNIPPSRTVKRKIIYVYEDEEGK